jgi:hypothetical protein
MQSCHKKYHTTVQGQVINYGSRKPIADVKVFLQDGIGTSGSIVDGKTMGSGYAEVYTDSLGKFNISLEGEYEAFLGYMKDGYSSATDMMHSYPDGKTNNEILKMYADANFNPILQSKNTSYSTDTIFFDALTNSKTSTGWLNCTLNGIGPFSNIFSIDAPAIGDTYQFYTIKLTRNKIITTKTDSVFIKAFTTYRDTIYY